MAWCRLPASSIADRLRRSQSWRMLFLSLTLLVLGASPSGERAKLQEFPVVEHAAGAFTVEMKPETGADAPVGRFSLLKRYSGDLQADSTGQMLAVGTEVKGSAGYVAMERVTGTLKGRSGSFALQHLGVMDRGGATLSVRVVPDSGTGDLKGLSGEMTITLTEGRHDYSLTYTLAR